jgi:hypothetical protein
MWKKLQKLWKNLENRKDWLGILYRILVIATFPIWGLLFFVLVLFWVFIIFPIAWICLYVLTGENYWDI